MTVVLIQFMWLEALAYPLDLLVAGIVSVVAWHWIVKGWREFTNRVWKGED